MKEILYHFLLHLGWGMLATTLLVPPKVIGRTFYVLNSLCVLVLWLTALILGPGGLENLSWWLSAACVALMLSFMLDPAVAPRPSLAFLGLALVASGGAIVQASMPLVAEPFYMSLPALMVSFFSSSLLVGGVMVAMILGHFYLVTPGLSFGLLGRFTKVIGALLVVRLAMGLLPVLGGNLFERPEGAHEGIFFIDHVAFLSQRGLVLVALAVLLPMIWDCVKRRANQAATGLLYVASFLALMGEGVATYFAVAYALPI